MRLDLDDLAFPAKHQPIFARRGTVATSQPLATQAGLEMLHSGGNAVDAALATAITLTVVEPASNGIGGDTFAIVWDGNKLHGLNGSGRAPATLTVDEVHRRGYDSIPSQGWLPVTVPGSPAAWRDLHDRFGRLPFESLFEPAIHYAEHGYPVSGVSIWHWKHSTEHVYPRLSGLEFADWRTIFAPAGRALHVGEMWRSPEMAESLRRIARSGSEDFYHGTLAARLAEFAARTGGFITQDDLARHTSSWVEPISTSYRGYDVWEMPPNGQGLAALIALNIVEGFDLSQYPRESVESYHLQLEAMKLAFADAHRYIADPEFADVPTSELLSKEYAGERRGLVSESALTPQPGKPTASDTVYLCAADADGIMVSFIQSVSAAFGSYVVVPGTGIVLQNRGSNFTLDPGHPNQLSPGKRSYHTIIPGFLTREGQPLGPFGVMGGHMQPQGHMQMVVNTIDYGMNPQASLDAPRWSWRSERHVKLEPAVSPEIAEGLAKRGHEVEVDPEVDWAGRGQIIWRLDSGAYVVGSDPRADGQAAGY